MPGYYSPFSVALLKEEKQKNENKKNKNKKQSKKTSHFMEWARPRSSVVISWIDGDFTLVSIFPGSRFLFFRLSRNLSINDATSMILKWPLPTPARSCCASYFRRSTTDSTAQFHKSQRGPSCTCVGEELVGRRERFCSEVSAAKNLF